MKLRVIFATAWLAISGVVYAGEETSTNDSVISDDMAYTNNAGREYIGGSAGWGNLEGLDLARVDHYYSANGYDAWGGSGSTDDLTAGDFFVGYRLKDNLALQLTYSWFANHLERTYMSFPAFNYIETRRTFDVSALSFSAQYRPIWHTQYFELGAHLSQLQTWKKVMGTASAATVSSLAAGEPMPNTGISTGAGALIGIGFEIRTSTIGVVRLAARRYFRVGGTTFGMSTIELGYLFNLAAF